MPNQDSLCYTTIRRRCENAHRRKTIRAVLQSLKNDYALRKVHIFGSYAENRATDRSDPDLLVEFDEPAISLITLNSLRYDLEASLGLSVDVIHAPLRSNSMIQPQKVVQVL